MTHFLLQLFDEQRHFEVTRQGDQLHISSESLAVDVHILHQDEGSLLIEYVQPDGSRRRVRLAGMRQGDKRQVWVEGRRLTGERVRRRQTGGAEHDGSLASAIPAVVSQVLVNPGDPVKAGDKLILLESMKMVIPIQAPYDGRVTEVRCAAGDSVPAGVPLVEIEPI